MKKKNILLLEPSYKNKYPPLGLMKIAQYHRNQKIKHNIIFCKGEDDPKLSLYKWDRIYITTLFSFEWRRTEKCIDHAIKLVDGKKRKIFVGGISASLMFDEYVAVKRWEGVRFIQGILKVSPAESLGLKYNDFGNKDNLITPIDELVPDYSILDHIEYKYPVIDAYFGYSSRGCIRKCKFCGVPKLEGDQRDMPPLSKLVHSIDELYGTKKDLVLMDNNVTAAPKFNEIMAEIRDLGFGVGAKLKRNGRTYKRRVDFNQGVDSRLLAKNSNLLKQLATICISPLRIAFDHLGVRKYYESAIREAADLGITSLSNYMLYNFYDSPEDLYKRLAINIDLNIELGVRIWSFPMRYQPVLYKDRSFIGKKWNRYYLRSFQIILHATHGVVTGNPSFFNMAFGSNVDEFLNLLRLPHEFIFNREYYFKGEGRPVLDEFYSNWNKLSQLQRSSLIEILSGEENQKTLKVASYIELLSDSTIDPQLRNIIRFYVSYGRALKAVDGHLFSHKDLYVPEDQKVEDAGLNDFENYHPIPHKQYNLPLMLKLKSL